MPIDRLLALALAASAIFATERVRAAQSPTASANAEGQHGFLHGYQKLREPWSGDLDGMIERGYIRVLVVPNKTAYFLDGAQQRGITFEATQEFEAFINKKLTNKNRKIHVVLIPVARDQLLPAIANGTGDIAAAGIKLTAARRELVDFSDPALRNIEELVVYGPGASFSPLDGLGGLEVHVRPSSTYHANIVLFNEKRRETGEPAVIIRQADENLEDEDLLEMVNAGLIPATVVDNHKAELWAEILPDIHIYPDAPIHAGGSIAWALRKNSPRLMAAINEFAAGHRAGTLFGNILLKRYLRNNRWAKNATSEREMRKFRSTVELFKKYAARYEFDWLIIMAQAYQESGLDQNVESRTGAVGVMQLLPSTAAGPPIKVEGIDEVENNIHAGVKYLRFIVDEYFDDDDINDLNKTLFAFASYNGGPNRIARLRQEANEQGLDPNRWFKNVELLAARQIGQEVVQYVSNIYKYYIAYKLIAERERTKPQPAD